MKKLPTREEVLNTIYEVWDCTLATEDVWIEDAVGRVAAEDIFSEVTLPAVRASTCDGIAVNSKDFVNGCPDLSGFVYGVNYERADTGDDFPDCYDSVIQIEDVELDENGRWLSLLSAAEVKPGKNVRAAGTTIREGELVFKKNTTIRTVDLVSIATGGRDKIRVYRKLRIAFIPTGSELVPIGTKPRRGEMIDTNSILVQQMIRDLYCEPVMYPIVKDDPLKLRACIEEAEQNDVQILIVNGGSSKGSEDYNVRLLKEKGTQLFHWVGVVPGKPMGIFMLGKLLVIVLPGPALAAFNGMEWLIKALVAHVYQIPLRKHEVVSGTLLEDMDGPLGMEFLKKVQVYKTEKEGYVIEQIDFRKTTIPKVFGSNALYYWQPGSKTIPAGTNVEVELLCSVSEIPEMEV